MSSSHPLPTMPQSISNAGLPLQEKNKSTNKNDAVADPATSPSAVAMPLSAGDDGEDFASNVIGDDSWEIPSKPAHRASVFVESSW